MRTVLCFMVTLTTLLTFSWSSDIFVDSLDFSGLCFTGKERKWIG